MRLFSRVTAACLGPLRAAKVVLTIVLSHLAGGAWWLRQLRLHVWLVEGTQRDCGQSLSILCAVSEDEQPYLLKVIFGDSYERRYLGRFWLWKVARLRPTPSCDFSMVVAETYESHLGVAHLRDWFFIPTWVGGNVALPRDGEATRKVGGDLRRIRQHGLRCEITRDPQQFDDFYYNMYVPYLSQTFGDCATIASYERFQSSVKVSELLLIKNQEKSIAGQLIMHDDKGSCLGVMGIRDGNRDYVRAGAGCALYHYGLQYLQEQGHTKAWLGWTRPFLRDGVLRFKKKWSQRLMHGTYNGFVLKVVSATPATTSFLSNNPFLFKRDGQFFGAVFANDESSLTVEDVAQLDEDYFHAGMSRVFVYNLSRSQANVPDPLPHGLSERIELCSASNCPGVEASGLVPSPVGRG